MNPRLEVASDANDHTLTLGLGAIAALLVLISITLVTGVSQEQFELVRDPAAYAADLRAHPAAVRAVFAVDTAFLVLYSAFFLLLGRRLATDATRALITIATGAMLITALLDMIEDHHILALLGATAQDAPPSASSLVFQHTLSQVKFNVSYVGLFLFGLAVPRTHRVGAALALLLTVGTIGQSVFLYAAPAELQAVGGFVRWLGFIVGFALALAVVRRSDAPRPGPAAAG